MTAVTVAVCPLPAARWLDAVGFDDDDHVSVCWTEAGVFRSQILPVRNALPVVEQLAGADCWISANPLRAGITAGRGTAADVIGLRSVWADLDVKPGGMPSFAEAEAVIAAVSAMLGTVPVAVVMSGHGLQPRWLVERGEGTDWTVPTDAAARDAAVLVRRFGRLVQHVAECHGGSADPVFDLARVLRCPGTTNLKGIPVATTLELRGGAPVTLGRITEALDEYGVAEAPEDREAVDGELSSPGSWSYGTRTCGYVSAMMQGWATDKPTARHPWLVAQAVRLAAAHRQGCITEADHQLAVSQLVARFRTRLNVGSKRLEAPGEIAGALAWGRVKVSAFTEVGVADELGRHGHPGAGLGLDGLVSITPVDGLPDHGGHHDDLDRDAAVERVLAFNREVQAEAYRIRVREDARVLVTAERAAQTPAPPFDAGTLGQVLARPPEPQFRVEGLLPAGGSMLVVAQRKTGKTTLELNLARSLLTAGEHFLGAFQTRPVTGTVALLNYEVSGAQLARWADDVGIDRDRLFLVNLRGRRNPLGNVDDRERLVELLVLHSVSTLLVDPFGRAFDGKSQNDPGEVGMWLAGLDRFAADVGATETVLAAHAGWNGERTRGSSALEDWADTIVTLVRDPDDESQRFLKAIGRDVEVEEDRLTFDPTTRLLRLSGSGSRKVVATARKIDGLVESVVEVVTETPGLNIDKITRELRSREIGFRTHEPSRAASRAVEQGLLVVRQEGRAKLHYPPTLPTLPDTSRGGVNASLPTLSIGEGCIERDTEPSSLPAARPLDRCPHHNQPIAAGIGCFECARRAATS